MTRLKGGVFDDSTSLQKMQHAH